MRSPGVTKSEESLLAECSDALDAGAEEIEQTLFSLEQSELKFHALFEEAGQILKEMQVEGGGDLPRKSDDLLMKTYVDFVTSVAEKMVELFLNFEEFIESRGAIGNRPNLSEMSEKLRNCFESKRMFAAKRDDSFRLNMANLILERGDFRPSFRAFFERPKNGQLGPNALIELRRDLLSSSIALSDLIDRQLLFELQAALVDKNIILLRRNIAECQGLRNGFSACGAEAQGLAELLTVAFNVWRFLRSEAKNVRGLAEETKGVWTNEEGVEADVVETEVNEEEFLKNADKIETILGGRRDSLLARLAAASRRRRFFGSKLAGLRREVLLLDSVRAALEAVHPDRESTGLRRLFAGLRVRVEPPLKENQPALRPSRSVQKSVASMPEFKLSLDPRTAELVFKHRATEFETLSLQAEHRITVRMPNPSPPSLFDLRVPLRQILNVSLAPYSRSCTITFRPPQGKLVSLVFLVDKEEQESVEILVHALNGSKN